LAEKLKFGGSCLDEHLFVKSAAEGESSGGGGIGFEGIS
jgi:hypothetical protein